MANLVTTACVSSAPVTLDSQLDHGRAVDQMIAHWRARLETVLPDQPDVVVLPEHCDRPVGPGYTRERQFEFLHDRGELVREFFADVASRHRTYLAYSAYRETPDGRAYNSTQLLGRDGSVLGTYDKNFLTIKENELAGLTYGTDLPVFELDFGRVAAVICFDLNFEELRARCETADPDLIVFSSAYHGGLMQSYWAYTCGAYFASAVYPPAPSGVVSPVGQQVASTTNYRHEVVTTLNLDYAVVHIDYNHHSFAALKNKYGRAVRIHDPGQIGSVLLSAESPGITITDIVKEFDLELLPDYFARVRAHRDKRIATPTCEPNA